MLATAKTSAVLSEFTDRLCTSISFRIATEFGLLTFRLSANIDAVYLILHRSRLIAPRLRTRPQAARVAWRIIRQWLDTQLAMIQAGLVGLEQVMLPFAQDSSGLTLYECMAQQKIASLQTPPLSTSS